MSLETPRRPNAAIPVAKPVAPPVGVQTKPDEEKAPEASLLDPSSIKGWTSSLGLHAVLLLVFGLWVFSPPRNEGKSFDSRIGEGAGEEGGGGGTLDGTEGIDQPLVLEPAPPTPADERPRSLSASALQLDPEAALKASLAANTVEGGANNPGAGAGHGGAGDGFGLARFGSGTELVGGVGVKVGDPQFTLIWDTQADIDLHVLEPGGAEIFWEQPHGGKGGELDVDDIDGFGPENVFWVQGKGPPGTYKWFVHYYGGLGGRNVPTNWKVRLKHNGKVTVFRGKLSTVGLKSRVYSFVLDAPESEQ
jgi:hypothetical protein